MEFQAFKKIPRLLSMPMVITEKIDGTNAQIHIPEPGEDGYDTGAIYAASRSRYVTPGADNFGFAQWVERNRDSLLRLGPGRHYGEWWGSGIQRGYGLAEKRFSLFNTGRWSGVRPECCSVVPVLYYGQFSSDAIEEVKAKLLITGSVASPGFMRPEGIVVFLPKANLLFKSTYDNDDKPKGLGADPTDGASDTGC